MKTSKKIVIISTLTIFTISALAFNVYCKDHTIGYYTQDKFLKEINYAIVTDDVRGVKKYLKLNMNVDTYIDSDYCNDESTIDYICWSPPTLACHLGRTEIIQLLIDNGVKFDNVDLGIATKGKTWGKRYETVKLLLDSGVNPNSENEQDNTVLDEFLNDYQVRENCDTKKMSKRSIQNF